VPFELYHDSFSKCKILFVKKESNNYVIYSGDENGNQLQLTSSIVNSWRPRKTTKLKKLHLLEQVVLKIIFTQ
jgi:hypothetical protein